MKATKQIGPCTEEQVVANFGDAGFEVTASHNPINYNGMKIVKTGPQPLR